MSYDSSEAKAYRKCLGSRDRQSSTPKAVEFGDRRLETFPVTHHTHQGTVAAQTVPPLGGTSHPNEGKITGNHVAQSHRPNPRGGFNLNSTRNISNTFQSGGKK